MSRGAFFGGKAISSTANIRVFHRKLFKNNIDDSGAEGIAQLFQSCPGIEDQKNRKMDDDGLCVGCCVGMCWRYYYIWDVVLCCVVVFLWNGSCGMNGPANVIQKPSSSTFLEN